MNNLEAGVGNNCERFHLFGVCEYQYVVEEAFQKGKL